MSEHVSFTFNTGRQYAANGQEIAVEAFGDQDDMGFWDVVIMFHDRSRMIAGKIVTACLAMDQYNLKMQVMHHYDTNEYDISDDYF